MRDFEHCSLPNWCKYFATIQLGPFFFFQISTFELEQLRRTKQRLDAVQSQARDKKGWEADGFQWKIGVIPPSKSGVHDFLKFSMLSYKIWLPRPKGS